MKVKALKNLGGAVNAIVGQEVEVTEAQALDLINQGVAEPVNANEYMTLKAMSSEELAKVREMSAYAQTQFENAVSEAHQKTANQQADQLEAEKKAMAEQMKSHAESHAQQMQAEAQAIKEAEAQAQKLQAQAQVKATTTHNQSQSAQVQTKQQNQ